MRVVVTNDDGIASPGIHALAAMLRRMGHDVTVVAPAADLSGAAAAIGRITLGERLAMQPHRLPGDAAGIPAFALDGPPGLAVLVACQGGAGDPPELVVSGINAGPNTGHSILHSGTVGAALTAASFGVSAIAVSAETDDPTPWHLAEPHLALAVDVIATAPEATVFNLNVPARPARGLRWAALDRFGTVRVAVAERADTWVQMEFRDPGPPRTGSDTALLAEGFATLTAIRGIGEVPPHGTGEGPGPQPEGHLTEVRSREP